MERALVLRRHFFGVESPEVVHACRALAEMCNLLSMSFLQQDNYAVALELLKKAELLSQHHAKEKATTLNNLACYYRRLGKLHTAMGCLKKALAIETKTLRDRRHAADTHLNLCAVLSQLNKHEHALEHAQAALGTLQEEFFTPNANANGGGEDHVDQQRASVERASVMCIAYYNMGVEQEFLQDYESCVRSYKTGVGLAEQYLGVDHAITTSLRNACLAAKRTIATKPRRVRDSATSGKPKMLAPRALTPPSPLRLPSPLTKEKHVRSDLPSPRSIVADALAKSTTILPPLDPSSSKKYGAMLSPQDPFFSPRFRFDAGASSKGRSVGKATLPLDNYTSGGEVQDAEPCTAPAAGGERDVDAAMSAVPAEQDDGVEQATPVEWDAVMDDPVVSCPTDETNIAAFAVDKAALTHDNYAGGGGPQDAELSTSSEADGEREEDAANSAVFTEQDSGDAAMNNPVVSCPIQEALSAATVEKVHTEEESAALLDDGRFDHGEDGGWATTEQVRSLTTVATDDSALDQPKHGWYAGLASAEDLGGQVAADVSSVSLADESAASFVPDHDHEDGIVVETLEDEVNSLPMISRDDSVEDHFSQDDASGDLAASTILHDDCESVSSARGALSSSAIEPIPVDEGEQKWLPDPSSILTEEQPPPIETGGSDDLMPIEYPMDSVECDAAQEDFAQIVDVPAQTTSATVETTLHDTEADTEAVAASAKLNIGQVSSPGLWEDVENATWSGQLSGVASDELHVEQHTSAFDSKASEALWPQEDPVLDSVSYPESYVYPSLEADPNIYDGLAVEHGSQDSNAWSLYGEEAALPAHGVEDASSFQAEITVGEAAVGGHELPEAEPSTDDTVRFDHENLLLEGHAPIEERVVDEEDQYPK
jgi:hypothetical protein